MSSSSWRERAGTLFTCDKRPAMGARGMVVTNHPLASAAAADMLAAGGNAVDAAIAAFFTLGVVEPMMVGLFGGGTAVIRLADGREHVLDGLSLAPAAARPDSYKPISDTWPDYMEVEGRANAVGASSVAVPGNLAGWCEALARWGTLDRASVMAPAIRHASEGFRVSPYLNAAIALTAADLARDPAIAAIFLPDGKPAAAGSLLVQAELADSLRTIAREGPGALYGGALGRH
jgi:gamma-glutamyltranspeptidase/glutathione hydrolase